MIVVLKSRQSIFDISIQYLGSAEGVFDLLKLNNLNSLNVPAGTQLQLPNTVINRSVRSFYLNEKIDLATLEKIEPTGSFSNSFSNSFKI